jgi:hypothetical protein
MKEKCEENVGDEAASETKEYGRSKHLMFTKQCVIWGRAAVIWGRAKHLTKQEALRKH